MSEQRLEQVKKHKLGCPFFETPIELCPSCSKQVPDADFGKATKLYQQPKEQPLDEGLPALREQFTIQLWRTYSFRFDRPAISWEYEPDNVKAIWRRESASIFGL